MSEAEQFLDQTAGEPTVRGFLHRSASGNCGLVLTHGAGGNCNSPLLIALAETCSQHGMTVLRCDLSFRQQRPHGPPLGTAEVDQHGLHRAAEVLRKLVEGRIILGGQSYGGRMATMLAAKEPSVAAELLLLSYPLHPPCKPQQLRTAHFSQIRTRSLFVQGTRDPFAAIEEMESALKLIPAETRLLQIEGAGHELASKKSTGALSCAAVAQMICEALHRNLQ